VGNPERNGRCGVPRGGFGGGRLGGDVGVCAKITDAEGLFGKFMRSKPARWRGPI
jgi:hypothetical protein